MNHLRSLAMALTTTAVGLAGCGDGAEEQAATAASVTLPEKTQETIRIKTRLDIPTGEILPGSRIGDSAFCPGGTFHDERGDEAAGEGTVVKNIRCRDGLLTITFSPESQSANKQTGLWRILDGTGRYAGLRGDGKMRVHFTSETEGRETFTGTVVG